MFLNNETGLFTTKASIGVVINKINEVAKSVRERCQIFIVIGIGGSYIGSQAGITFLKSSFPNQLCKEGLPEIYFSGHNISSDYHADLLELIEGREWSDNQTTPVVKGHRP